ncbi:hypothetical protein [Roseibacillus ishigakijimensis]|uniref:hypothetical protein n=1 Tax=Roseibacillus ishigakijimensis TaxID=454146 RepID=UPI00366F9B62
MADDGDLDFQVGYQKQKMVGKPFEITPPSTTGIKMVEERKSPGIIEGTGQFIPKVVGQLL